MVRTSRPDDTPRLGGCEWADVHGGCTAQARWRHTWTPPMDAVLHVCDRHSGNVRTATVVREMEIDR
jgi:hypothetical protein